MNILFISKEGDSVSLAKRVEDEGHTSHLYITNSTCERAGEGLVNKVDTRQPIINSIGKMIKSSINQLIKDTSPEVVVLDRVGLGGIADYLVEQHIPVVGGAKWADILYLQTPYKFSILKAANLTNNNKPIKDGVRVACEIWWNGTSSQLQNISLVSNKQMSGDVGGKVECGGLVLRSIPKKVSVFRRGVSKIENLLKKTNYKGPITLSSECNKDGMRHTNLFVGFSYNSLQAMLEIYKGSVVELLHGIGTGGSVSTLYSDYSTAVHLSLPPYPHKTQVSPTQIEGYTKHNDNHIWLKDAMLHDDGLFSGGGYGDLGCVTSHGQTVRESRRRVYRTISNLHIEDVQYRNDIGEGIETKLRLLRSWGYI